MSDQQQQQEDDARVALRARLPEADDEASQGETTSVETPEGRLHRLGERLSRRDRDRDSDLRLCRHTDSMSASRDFRPGSV